MTTRKAKQPESPAARLAEGILQDMIAELDKLSANWSQLTKDQQDVSIDRLRSHLMERMNEAITQIQAGSFSYAHVHVESLTKKAGTKSTILVKSGIHQVIDRVGRDAVLLIADPEQFFDGLEDIEGEDEQKKLDLNKGGNDAAE